MVEKYVLHICTGKVDELQSKTVGGSSERFSQGLVVFPVVYPHTIYQVTNDPAHFQDVVSRFSTLLASKKSRTRKEALKVVKGEFLQKHALKKFH